MALSLIEKIDQAIVGGRITATGNDSQISSMTDCHNVGNGVVNPGLTELVTAVLKSTTISQRIQFTARADLRRCDSSRRFTRCNHHGSSCRSSTHEGGEEEREEGDGGREEHCDWL